MKKNLCILTTLLCVALTGCLDNRKPMASRLVKGVVFGKAIEGEKKGKFGIDSGQTSFSRSKHDSYCWLAVLKDGQAGKSTMVTETFQLPDRGVFTGDGSTQKVKASDDGKTWTITGAQAADKKTPTVSGCWTAADNDPLGDYRLTIDVAGEFQHTFNFSIEQ